MALNKVRSLLLAGLLVTVASVSAPLTARAQICPGSNLFYVVRDARGAVIDAGGTDVRYEGDGSDKTYSHWGADALKADRLRSKSVAPDIAKLDGKVTLKNQAMCIFKEDLKLRITLAGKTMNLLFHVPRLSEYDSKDFVVDSLPFKTGDYEITLGVPPETWVNYYAASAWKKVAAKP
jgi:hypothetical protein